MRFFVNNIKTGEKACFPYEEDIENFLLDVNPDEWSGIFREIGCRGCLEYKDDTQERFDFFGITTGYYCDGCYENNYPFRKDRYPTIEHDGYGERLGLDEEY